MSTAQTGKAVLKKLKQCDTQCNHTLKVSFPQEKIDLKYDLRCKGYHRPEINTDCFNNTFVNRLLFKYSVHVQPFLMILCVKRYAHFFNILNLFIISLLNIYSGSEMNFLIRAPTGDQV